MSKDATDQGVSNEEQEKLVEAARNSTAGQRLEAVKELAAQHREQRDADMRAEGIEPPDTTGEPDNIEIEDPNDEGEEQAAAPAAKKEDKAGQEEQEEETITLKVDGQDVEVPLSKIKDAGIRTLQKESAADVRLAEATQLLKEAKEQTSRLSQDVGKNQQENDSELSPVTVDAKELANTLINGDIDEVTDAVQKLMGSGRQDSRETATQIQNMDQSQIFGFVQNALELEKAQNIFKADPKDGGFGDLYSDATLQKMVLDKEEELVNNGDTRPMSERLMEAAKEVREWRKGILKDAGVNVADFDETLDKKKNAQNSVDTSGGRQQQEQSPKKPLTSAQKRTAAINKMAQARGQTLD